MIEGAPPKAALVLDKHAERLGLDVAQLEDLYADVWALLCERVAEELADLEGE